MSRLPAPRYFDANGEPSQRPAILWNDGPRSARSALTRVYGHTAQGFPASLALAALDVDKHRHGALEVLTATIALAETAGRIEPGKLDELLAAMGQGVDGDVGRMAAE